MALCFIKFQKFDDLNKKNMVLNIFYKCFKHLIIFKKINIIFFEPILFDKRLHYNEFIASIIVFLYNIESKY